MVSSNKPLAFRSCSSAAIGPSPGFGEIAMQHDVVVIVPGLEISVVHLHHAHAALAQPARNQAASGEVAVAIACADMFGLLCDIERLRSFLLHSERNLGRLDTRFQLRIAALMLQVHPIQLGQQIEFLALLVVAQAEDSECVRSASSDPFRRAAEYVP